VFLGFRPAASVSFFLFLHPCSWDPDPPPFVVPVVDARRKVAPDVGNGCAHSFTFKDLLVATGYFNQANFIGQGGFGKVYKGKISRTNAQASPTPTIHIPNSAPPVPLQFFSGRLFD
jgi:hypothetical protein